MQREILFKGKCLKSNEWVFGNLVRYRGNQQEFTTAIQVLDENKEVVSVMNVDPETVCQFTGLTDKNGVKIFEGDIIIFGDRKIKQVVEYKKGQYMARQLNTKGSHIGLGYCDWEFHSEVIGNIHD